MTDTQSLGEAPVGPLQADPWSTFTGPPVAADQVLAVTSFRRFLRRFGGQPMAVGALAILLLLVLAAIAAPRIAPFDPLAQDLQDTLQGPTSEHWLGTDELGRDVLSRMLFAARVSLVAAAQAVLLAIALGVLPGLIAGFLRGWVDAVISRITDAVMSFPPLLLAIAIVGVFGPSLTNAMLAVGVIFAPRFLRVTRGAVLAVREETFVEASRSIGTPVLRIIATRILPNILSPLLVQTSLALGFAMLAEASLSFLGLGVQPPDASWGAMIGRAYRFLAQTPTLVIFPGIAIAVCVLAFNILGDGLRDSFGRDTRGAGR